MKTIGILSERERLANQVAVTINNSCLVFFPGRINTDNIFAFDPVAFLVKLLLVHKMLISFFDNKRIGCLFEKKY